VSPHLEENDSMTANDPVVASADPLEVSCSIEASVCAKLSFATHQSAVPVLRDLRVTNNSNHSLQNLELEISADPAVFLPRMWTLDQIRPGSSTDIRNRDLVLNAEFLLSIQEAVSARIMLKLWPDSDRGEDTGCIAIQSYPVEILAASEWGGAVSMAELLAMFVQPNNAAVARILKASAEVLRKADKPDRLDGYEAKTRARSYELASAVWSAISGLRLTYALPPASFETQGQKVRAPQQIVEQGLATCLDTALLFAATLEQIGLNPVLILTKGHAFTGVWLQPQEFASLITEDASTVRKRVALQELLLFETTLCMQSSSPAFSKAIAEGNRQIAENHEGDFVMALDLRRARMQRLRPLALPALSHTGSNRDSTFLPAEESAEISLEAAPALPAFDINDSEVAATPEGRLQRWQRKLLDLTARNRLLHAPLGTSGIPILCPDPGQLEDELADGKSFRIVAAPQMEDAMGRDTELHQSRTGEVLDSAYASDALARGEVLSLLKEPKLDAQLVELFRKSRLDFAEGGSNTLFLAVGFLNWKKNATDTRVYRAPLLLLPVKLDRRSVRSGVRLSLLDDEPRMNLTLLEMLRQEFRLEVPELAAGLPTDGHGVDVAGIWTAVRKAVRDTPGFEVTEDVLLGSFSFAKYLMWKDLVDRTETLKANRVVRHLLETPREPYPYPAHPPRPEELDQDVAPGELFTPLPADSSQLAAVVGSARGCDFVLDGPPGTGKSQTIANMIAHNLALGRRVLFVAEKRAALDVVHRRLRANGLGPFCLELHSNKANKKEVLDQLDRAWTTAEELPAEAWARDAEAICRERDALNALVKALHQVHPNGWTVHRAIGRVLLDAASPVQLHWPQQVTHDDIAMRVLKDVARRLGLQRTAVATLDMAAFQRVGETEWSNAWQASLSKAASFLAATIAACSSARAALLQRLGVELSASGMGLSALAELVDFLPEAARMRLGFVFGPNALVALDGAQKASTLIAGYAESARGLSSQYSPDAIKALPLEHLASEWEKAKTAAWPISVFKRKAVLHELSTLGMPNLDLDRDLDRLRQMRESQETVARLGEQAKSVPGWDGVGTDTQAMERTIVAAAKLRLLVARAADSPAQTGALRLTLQSLLGEKTEELLVGSPLHQVAAEYSRTYSLFSGALAEFDRLAEPSDSASTPDLFETTGRQTSLLIANISGLNRWTAWLRVRKEALSLGLEPLVDALEQGSVSPADTLPAFESAYARWWVEQALDEAPVLRTFNLAEHTDRLARFRSLDDDFASLTKRYIRAKLCGVIPSKIDPKLPPGFATLHHQLQLSKRHKPVRQLVTEMGTALTTLAPCLLMSPLSVAQYLPANAPLFDVVIFDEASQIAPWDAVGAIARGRQLIVAGDPKQMPPTSFFSRGAGADDDSDLADDQESLLDECLGAALPRHRLTWHYRSLHESLIAFSNHRYYEGDLLTFPAPVTRDSAVTLKRVAGSWSRGKSRTNQIEAEAIVEEVVRRLTDAPLIDAEGHFPSIAVITLNAEQQKLIEDLLDKARAQNPAIERFFAEDATEPVVIKNLETVQGDERDIVLLGIGYGPETPDAPSMPMNFGPLNRAGGWRRLNVAITRARREMLVYTSFPPHLIDLNRTSSDALRDLKHFLEFAEQGPRALGQAIAGSLGGYESPFEEAVAEGLRNLGWSIVPQVGVSRYRVDLGIVHPDRPGDYLVGVECDGAMYHSAATARDRDKVRESVLRQLGWRLLRVWSTDWWIDRRAALQQLHARLEVLLAERRGDDQDEERKRLEKEALKSKATEILNESSLAFTDESSAQGELQQLQPVGQQSPPAYEILPVSAEDSPMTVDIPSLQTALQPNTRPDNFQQGVYRATCFDTEKLLLQPDQFFEPTYSPQIAELIAKIVQQESPLRDDVLVERIARAHGFLRSGNRIRDRVLSLAQSAYYLLMEEGGATFVWADVGTASSWSLARFPATNDDCRSIEDIALVELAAAFPKNDQGAYVTQVARNFGVKRLGLQARLRLERASTLFTFRA
jgi:very-short-patch-repair endonuclease